MGALDGWGAMGWVDVGGLGVWARARVVVIRLCSWYIVVSWDGDEVG